MNKLEEYRDKKVKERWGGNLTWNLDDSDLEREYGAGFDAAIALDLPVKFAEWYHEYELGLTELSLDFTTLKELYNHWIENIYKPE